VEAQRRTCRYAKDDLTIFFRKKKKWGVTLNAALLCFRLSDLAKFVCQVMVLDILQDSANVSNLVGTSEAKV